MYRKIPILYRILESFFRYRTLFLISTLVITLIPAAVLLTRKTTYTSTAMVQVIEDNSPVLGDINRQTSWLPIAQQHVNKFNDLLSDDAPGGFVDTALQLAHLSRPISVDPRVKDPRLAVLRKGLSISTVSDTVFAINLVWDNAAESEQIVKAMQQEYVDRTGQEKQAQATAVVQFLDSELEKYAERLRVAEKAVHDFRVVSGGHNEAGDAAMIDQLNELKIQYNDLEVSSHNNDIKQDQIQKRLAEIKPTVIDKQVIKDSPLVIRRDKLKMDRRDLLEHGYLPTSTRVQALDMQIASLDKEIKEESKDPNYTPGTSEKTIVENPEYRDLQSQLTEATIGKNTDTAQMEQLRQRIAEYESRIKDLPNIEMKYNDKMRDFTILKGEYEDLLKRREQARLKENLDKVSATVLIRSIGTVYAQSTGGKAKTAIMLVGLLIFGLILGLGVTVLAEWADPSLRFASDVQNRLGVPVLISLPELAPLRLVTSSPSVDGDMSGGRPLLPARDE